MMAIVLLACIDGYAGAHLLTGGFVSEHQSDVGMCVRAAALVLASRTVAILRRAIRAEAIVPERSLILDRGPALETDQVLVCAAHRDRNRVEDFHIAVTVQAEGGRLLVGEDVPGITENDRGMWRG